MIWLVGAAVVVAGNVLALALALAARDPWWERTADEISLLPEVDPGDSPEVDTPPE